MSTSTVHFRILVLSVLALVLGATVFWPTSPGSHAADAKASKLKALLKERLATLQEVASQTTTMYQSGGVPYVRVMEANQAVHNAELDLCDTDKERLAVLAKMLAKARSYEQYAAEQVKSGRVANSDSLQAKVNRLEVEIALERAKGE